MTHREILLYWMTVGFEILLCLLVYLRGLQRRLPFFTIHATLLLAGTLGLQLVYHHFGFRSSTSYAAAWVTGGMIVLARTFAVAELCRYELRAYQGIWALAWRALAVLAVFFLANATIDAWGQLNRIAIYELTIERDVEISSILILIVMLLVLKYYGLPLEPLHRWIALGICLVSIIDVMNNTVLHNAFAGALSSWFHTASASSWSGLKSQVESANDLWNLIHICGLMAAMSIWSFGLRKALPATAQAPVLLPADVYRDLSPAVNLRLRAFNDRLLEMLKP